MDLKKFYDSVGGSYEEIKNRLPTDKLIEKFVLMLPKDPCYNNLVDSMGKEDWKAAFTASHTLKGVSANLALKKLCASAGALTEDLRSGTPAPTTQENYQKVQNDYEAVIAALKAEGV